MDLTPLLTAAGGNGRRLAPRPPHGLRPRCGSPARGQHNAGPATLRRYLPSSSPDRSQCAARRRSTSPGRRAAEVRHRLGPRGIALAALLTLWAAPRLSARGAPTPRPAGDTLSVICPQRVAPGGYINCVVLALDARGHLDESDNDPVSVSFGGQTETGKRLRLRHGAALVVIGAASAGGVVAVSDGTLKGKSPEVAVGGATAGKTGAVAAIRVFCPATATVGTNVTCYFVALGATEPWGDQYLAASGDPIQPRLKAEGGTAPTWLRPPSVAFSSGLAKFTFGVEGIRAGGKVEVSGSDAAPSTGPAPPAESVELSFLPAAATGGLALSCPRTAVLDDPVTCTVSPARAPTGAPTAQYSGPLEVSVSPAGTAEGPGTVAASAGKSRQFPVTFYASPAAAESGPFSAEITASGSGGYPSLSQSVVVEPAGTYTGGEIFRLVGGGTASFAPAAQPTGKLFADMYIEWGLGCRADSGEGGGRQKKSPTAGFWCGGDTGVGLGSPWRYWIQADLLSTAQAANSTNLAALGASKSGMPTSGLNGLGAQSIQSLALRTGLARRIWTTSLGLDGIPHGASDTAFEAIADLGFTTPVSPLTAPPTIYCLVPAKGQSGCTSLAGLGTAPSDGSGYLVVNTPLRTSFFLNYGLGIRMQTFYANHTDSHQPAITDITIGQDQAVTSGSFGRPVLHIDGFWPVPGRADFLFLVFGGSLRLSTGRTTGFVPLPLGLAPVGTTGYTGGFLGPQFRQGYAPLLAADWFRVGVAVDVVDLLKHHLFGSPPAASSQSAGASAATQ